MRRVGAVGSTAFALAILVASACSPFNSDDGPTTADPDSGRPSVGGEAAAEVALEVPPSLVLIQNQTLSVEVHVVRKPPFVGGLTVVMRGLPKGVAADPVDVVPALTTATLKIVVSKGAAQGVLKGVTVEAMDSNVVIGKAPVDALVRGAAGELDTTFGKDGVVFLPEEFSRLAMKADGSFFVLAPLGGNTVRKYTKDGVLDTTFAAAGVYAPGADTPMNAIAWKSPYLFLAGGRSSGTPQWHLRRLHDNGAVDAFYATAGTHVHVLPGTNQVNALSIGPGGEAVIAGNEGGRATIAWVDSNGVVATVATTADGGLTRTAGPNMLTVVHQGTRWLAGGGPQLLRVSATTHKADPTFTSSGFFDFSLSLAVGAVVVDSAGNYVVGGLETNDLFAARVTPTGMYDPTFGQNGVFHTAIVTNSGGGALTLFGDKIIQVGTILEGPTFRCVVLRYTKAGALDASFGQGGKAVPILANDCYAGDVSTQPDGRIVVAGQNVFRLWP